MNTLTEHAQRDSPNSEQPSILLGVSLENTPDFKEHQLPNAAPNPFNNTIKLTFPAIRDEAVTIQFWDMRGRLAHSIQYLPSMSGVNELNVENIRLEAGFYYCSIKSNSINHTLKLLKMD